MVDHDIPGLQARLEAPDGPEAADLAEAARAIKEAFPGLGDVAEALEGTNTLLHLIDTALPSWSLHVQGSSATRAGRWTATIRETGVRDDDELIGVGKARTLTAALLSAFLKVIELRRR